MRDNLNKVWVDTGGTEARSFLRRDCGGDGHPPIRTAIQPACSGMFCPCGKPM